MARSCLIVLLFVPALTGSIFVSRASETSRAPQPPVADAQNLLELVRPRELVRIYSIVRSYRPAVAESEIWRLSEVIYQECTKRQLDPLMVLALIRVESRFQPEAVSPAGARGIMQIMPETGRTLAAALSREYDFSAAQFTAESLDDPVLNLRLGIYYLHDLKNRFQDWTATLTAYNFGPGDTLSRIENNMDLSEDFAVLVMSAYERYKRANHPSF